MRSASSVMPLPSTEVCHLTRGIYTHVIPPMRSDAADRLAEQIFGNVEPGKA